MSDSGNCTKERTMSREPQIAVVVLTFNLLPSSV
jgi:hypothetical protein